MMYRNFAPLAIFGLGNDGRWQPGDELHRGKVIGADHGDTIIVATWEIVKWKRVYTLKTVRLAGVWCPQTGTGEPLSKLIRRQTLEWCNGQNATIFTRNPTRGEPGHISGFLFVGGDCLNHALVRDGLAFWERRNDLSDDRLKEFEDHARSSRRGVWYNEDGLKWSDTWRERFKNRSCFE